MPKIIEKYGFISKLKKTWNIRLLTSDDANAIESFIELLNDFFQLCEGNNGSWIEILNACPSSKNVDRDKFVLGLYDEHTLVGLLDIISDYPTKGVWTIGYLLIHPKCQGLGIGSRIIKDLEKALRPSKLRCVTQKQNVRALRFWKSNGFVVTSQVNDTAGTLKNVTYVLER
ncbi:MAG: GNAT family N-acetyltransferase [Pseudomonadota bacterium]